MALWATHPLYRQMEIEANAAAAEFLLPYAWLDDMVQRHWGGPSTTPGSLAVWADTPAFRQVAAEAAVSPIMLGYHLIDTRFVAKEDRAPWARRWKR